MKSKIWLLLFAVLSILLYIGQNIAIDFILKKSFEESPIYDRGQWLEQFDLHPKVVFLGSSMARHSIIPKIIQKNSNLTEGDVVILGVNAATPYEMYLTYIKNKDRFTKTKVFYFSLEPWMYIEKYYQYKIFEKVLWSYDEWKRYMGDSVNYFSYKFQLYGRTKTEVYGRWPFNDYGYYRLNYDPDEKFKYADKKEILDFFNDYSISYFQLEYLKKLKDEIESTNTEFIILYVPNHISYTKSILNYNKKYNSQIEILLNRYLGKTKQFGSFDPNDYNLTEEDYFDRFHLDHSGAIKYTEYLGNVLELSNELQDTNIKIDYKFGKQQTQFH